MSRERVEAEALVREDAIVQFVDAGPSGRRMNGYERQATTVGIGGKAVYCDIGGEVVVLDPQRIRRLGIVPTAMFSGRNSIMILLDGEDDEDIWIDDVSVSSSDRLQESLAVLKAATPETAPTI